MNISSFPVNQSRNKAFFPYLETFGVVNSEFIPNILLFFIYPNLIQYVYLAVSVS